MSPSHITRYSVMPIPPVEAHTKWVKAGTVRIGVEYRLLNDAIAAAADLAEANGQERGSVTNLDDRGVSLHVVGEQDGVEREFLRFDCFEEDPHYHYVSWRDKANEMVHLDAVADGDPLDWALGRVRTRLGPMLERAGAADLAARLDAAAIEAALPEIAEVAFRVRASHRQDNIQGNTKGNAQPSGTEGANV
jgi:hypothetical protein